MCQPSPGAVLTEGVKAFHSQPFKSKVIAGKEIPACLRHQSHSEAQCRVGLSTAASAPAVTSPLIHNLLMEDDFLSREHAKICFHRNNMQRSHV